MDRNSLLSFLQGASNSAAGTVSAPVDGLAWLLRKAGVPMPAAPLGGSDWMAQQGLTREPQNKLAGLLGEAASMSGPIALAAKAPQVAAMANKAITNAAAPRTLNPQAGAVVWHGSPHQFDRFDISKIGTGEGAQAYGHGVYVAEAKAVADEYAGKLSKPIVTFGGRSASEIEGLSPEARRFAESLNSRAATTQYADRLGAVQKDMLSAPTKIQNELGYKGLFHNGYLDVADTGNLYKVDLPDEHIARMLDWDKPLSGQASNVRKGLLSLESGIVGEMFQPFEVGSTAGQAAYNALMRERASQAAASEALKRAGVPGIRYLDGGSRGAGAGSSNYVVFDDNLLRILERNGRPLP